MTDQLANVLAPLVVALILWLTGLPKKLYGKGRAFVAAQRLVRLLRQGPFDTGTIGRSVQYYVRPMCSVTDPSVEAEPAQALITPRESLFKVLDRFLRQTPGKRKHLLVLADSGMGKTSFLLNYFSARNPGFFGKQRDIQLISLAQADSDELIDSIPIQQRRSVDLFLDALDEDQRAVGRVAERVAEIVRATANFRSLVITCRTQFFSSDDEIPVETALYKAGPVPANESKVYCFRRLYLSPFDDSQIDEYLTKRYPGVFNLKRRSVARSMVRKIPALSVRPMLLAHLPDIIRSKSEIHLPVDVYDAMVDAWLIRESAWVSPEKLRSFSERLAVDLYFNSSRRGNEAAMPDEIQALAIRWGVDLDPAHLTSRSLLNRTGDGRYKFAHRSIMEFFVAEYLISGDIRAPVEITDQIAQFITQRLGCWDPETANFFAYSRIDLEHKEPFHRLGHATSHNLYSSCGDTVNVSRLMEVSVLSIGESLFGAPLAAAIIRASDLAISQGAGKLLEVVLHFQPSKWSDEIECYCSVWHKEGAALARLSLNGRSLARAMNEGSAEKMMESDFMLIGTHGENGVDRWVVKRRVFLPIVEATQKPLSFALSANPAISFYQRATGDAVTVRFFKRYLSRVGAAASYGILSDVKILDSKGGFQYLKPVDQHVVTESQFEIARKQGSA